MITPRTGWLLSLLIALVLFGASCAAFPTPAPIPTPTATPMPVYYTVQQGDTLYGIAGRFEINPTILVEVNELTNPDLLQPGQQLLISDRVTVSGRVLPTATPTPPPCVQGCKGPPAECRIKAFRARLDGTPMYVLPGDELYPRVEADLWFCQESEVRQAGYVRWTTSGPATP